MLLVFKLLGHKTKPCVASINRDVAIMHQFHQRSFLSHSHCTSLILCPGTENASPQKPADLHSLFVQRENRQTNGYKEKSFQSYRLIARGSFGLEKQASHSNSSVPQTFLHAQSPIERSSAGWAPHGLPTSGIGW